MTEEQEAMNSGHTDLVVEKSEPALPVRRDLPPERSLVVALLKNPPQVADSIAESRNLTRTGMAFLVCAIVCHAVFGLAIGLFGGWQVAFMDAAKGSLIVLCTLALCFPSLYVFACVGGTPLTIPQTFVLGTACAAMTGLLLVGLVPVAWLFAVSTDNIAFVTVLTVLIWLVALAFAIRFIAAIRVNSLFYRVPGIKFWFFVLVLVTLQMTTAMRPILTRPEAGWWTGEKMFFLEHFVSAFDAKPMPPATPPPEQNAER
jgi:hypothetical protein